MALIKPEYSMAYMLRAANEKGVDTVSFDSLYKFGNKLQAEIAKQGIDAIVKNHSYIAAIDILVSQFKYTSINSRPYVKLVNISEVDKLIFPDSQIHELMRKISEEMQI